MQQKEFDEIQKKIGYEFDNLDLLQQAFIRRSYSKENGGENNEVLEFIGDKALDFIVVRLLVDSFGYFKSECNDFDENNDYDEFVSEYQENKLTEIKKKLVEKATLAKCIDNLKFAKYLIMGKGDIKSNVQKVASVKEDLFEAIIGAVALDSDFDVMVLEDVIERMLKPQKILKNYDCINYVQEIQDWSIKNDNEIPKYEFTNLSLNMLPIEAHNLANIHINYRKNDDNYLCSVCLKGIKRGWSSPFFFAYGRSKTEARKILCKGIYDYLDESDMLYSIRDEIENPCRDLAINQLETLSRRGYFSIPEYVFSNEYDDDGNPVWKCECHIEEKEYFYYEFASSKKDAKKDAAYSMLKNVLSEE